MKLIFDFDHTIFNMMEMHQSMQEAMEKLGISKEDYQDAYDQSTKWKMFSTKRLAEVLSSRHDVTERQVVEALESLAKESELYLYDDVQESFIKMKESGHRLSLLSWGDENWQGLKIAHSGVRPHCEDVVSVTEVKADYLQKKYKEAGCLVVIDDKPAVLKAIEVASPEIKLIRMRREGAKYSDIDTPPSIPEAKNMEEVVQIISEMKCPIHD